MDSVALLLTSRTALKAESRAPQPGFRIEEHRHATSSGFSLQHRHMGTMHRMAGIQCPRRPAEYAQFLDCGWNRSRWPKLEKSFAS